MTEPVLPEAPTNATLIGALIVQCIVNGRGQKMIQKRIEFKLSTSEVVSVDCWSGESMVLAYGNVFIYVVVTLS